MQERSGPRQRLLVFFFASAVLWLLIAMAVYALLS